MGDYKVLTPDFLNMHISTSKNDLSFSEKKFPKDITISDLKAKLELMTGGNCSTMQLEVYDKDDKLVGRLEDDNRLFGSYSIDSGMRLHVVDKFSLRNEFDSGDVQKYELSQEEYGKKTDSVKAFLQKNKLGHYNEEYAKKKAKSDAEEKELAHKLVVGSRCKITIQNASPKLGTIRYIGSVEGLQGLWVGVQYDEPLGKHNGTLKDRTYFECPDKYGAFVKPHVVIMGDFPEENYDLQDEL